MKAVEKLAKAFQVPAILTIFSNIRSQNLVDKLGYGIWSEVKLSDYVEEKGQMIIPARSWKRPDDILGISFPHVWSQSTKKSPNGQIYKIKVQDITPDQYEEVWNMYKTYFYPGEDITNTAKVNEDEVSMVSQKWGVYQCFETNLSIIAVLDDHKSLKPVIVGGLLLAVISKTDPPLPVLPGEARAKVQNLFKKLFEDVDDVFEKLNIDCYFKDYGLVVHPEYRRLGIGTELLKAVEKIAKAFDVPAILTVFSNIKSQNLVEKLGYSIWSEVKLSNYVDEKGQMIIPTVKTKAVQARYFKFF